MASLFWLWSGEIVFVFAVNAEKGVSFYHWGKWKSLTNRIPRPIGDRGAFGNGERGGAFTAIFEYRV